MVDMNTAADRINEHPDLSAEIVRGNIEVKKYGKPAGKVTQDDIDQMDHTPTGWGKSLRKGALEVYRAIREE